MQPKARVRRLTLFIAVTGALLLAVAAAGLLFLTKTRVEPEREHNAAVQRKHLKAYLDDLDFVARERFFAQAPTKGRDASTTLNPKVPWQPRELGAKPPVERLVDPAVRDRILRLRSEWIEHPGAFRSAKADFSILKAMLTFDRWDIESEGPIAELAKDVRFVPPSRLPSPDTIEIMALVKLRLVTSIESDEELEALRETRQAAKLLFSSESLQLQLAALSLLDVERRAYRRFVETNEIEDETWRPIERSVVRRAARALWATRGYLRLLTPVDVFQSALLDPKREPLGLCAAANEAYPVELSLKPLLDGAWPGEHDYSENYQMLDRALERALGSCRLRYLSALIKGNRFDSDLPVPALFARLPWSRQMFGARLGSLNFLGFESYENPASK